MFDYLYEWIQNIAFYLVLVTAALNAVPNKDYRKYIRFFTGLVLILMLMTPVLGVFGADFQMEELYQEMTRSTEPGELERAWGGEEALEEAGDGGQQERETEEIEVEEIQIE